MRFSRFLVKPVAVLALVGGTVALAGDLATLDKFCVVSSTPCSSMLYILPSPAAVGQVCNVSANGLPVASVVLVPGGNYVMAPTYSATTCYVASGPGIESAALHPDNPGIN